MGLLDDLKKEAETLITQEAERTQSLKANAAQVDQSMRKVYQYLNDLFRQLNVVRPPCDRVYDFISVGKIGGLTQGDYRVEYRTAIRNNSENFTNLIITFRRTKPEQMEVRREAEQIERFRDLLWQNNMRFSSEQFRNDRRVVTHEVFKVNCEIICGVDIVSDFDEGVLRFKLKNVEDFGPTSYTLEPVTITDNALEEFAKLLIGKTESNFKAYNRRPTSNPATTTGTYKRPASQYLANPTAAAAPAKTPQEEEKKKGLFGLFKK